MNFEAYLSLGFPTHTRTHNVVGHERFRTYGSGEVQINYQPLSMILHYIIIQIKSQITNPLFYFYLQNIFIYIINIHIGNYLCSLQYNDEKPKHCNT